MVLERDARVAAAKRRADVDQARLARYVAALADYRAKGSAIVREGPDRCDFNTLRCEHARRDPAMLPPAACAAWLKDRIAELS